MFPPENIFFIWIKMSKSFTFIINIVTVITTYSTFSAAIVKEHSIFWAASVMGTLTEVTSGGDSDDIREDDGDDIREDDGDEENVVDGVDDGDGNDGGNNGSGIASLSFSVVLCIVFMIIGRLIKTGR